ncbi:hypothetical protein GCM10022393_01950 [Aquimarina addita]|uniref:Uncharacterized protein n=1 Tax=Aquimarina addita TaxID=870485 RepID=A0ABP7X8H3_9FLAO
MLYTYDQAVLKIKPLLEPVTYVQKINSVINCFEYSEKQELDRKMEVTIHPLDHQFFKITIKTTMHQVILNSVLKKQENFNREISGVLNTMEFKINQQGELLQILNHSEIIAKWNILKSKLKTHYVGQASERYLIGIERKIRDHHKLLLDCKQYRLYKSLLNDVYGTIYTNDEKDAKGRLYILQNACYQLPLIIQEKIIFQQENDQHIVFGIRGNLIEQQPYTTKINNLFQRKNIKSIQGITLDAYEGTSTYAKEAGLLKNMQLKVCTSYGRDYSKEQYYTCTKQL